MLGTFLLALASALGWGVIALTIWHALRQGGTFWVLVEPELLAFELYASALIATVSAWGALLAVARLRRGA